MRRTTNDARSPVLRNRLVWRAAHAARRHRLALQHWPLPAAAKRTAQTVCVGTGGAGGALAPASALAGRRRQSSAACRAPGRHWAVRRRHIGRAHGMGLDVRRSCSATEPGLAGTRRAAGRNPRPTRRVRGGRYARRSAPIRSRRGSCRAGKQEWSRSSWPGASRGRVARHRSAGTRRSGDPEPFPGRRTGTRRRPPACRPGRSIGRARNAGRAGRRAKVWLFAAGLPFGQ